MACGKTRFALDAIARQIAPTTRLRHSGLASAIIRPNSLRARAGGTGGPSGPSGVSYLAMLLDYGARARSAVKKCIVTCMVGWVIAGIGGVVGIVVLFMLFRSPSSGGGSRTRATDDGFFVRGFPRGSRIFWRARVNGTMRDGTADISGGETFVYTGGTPTDIAVKNIGAAAVIAAPVSSPPPSSDDSSPFDGFPSAY